MMAVGGFSRMLQQRLGPDDADGQHCLDRIVGNVQRMGELTDALLSLARLSGAAIEREPLDLGALARELAAELDEAGGAHRPTLCVKGDLRAWGNARLLRQVLANLLANAWKFTARQPRPAVEVGALPAAPGEPRVFYVRDNGAGFDMRRAADLFRPFHRLHPEHEFAGTGIGLAVVRKIVERHGGSVWAEAAPGLGATFYVSLPDADGADAADAG
jgi:signal transduction histidine kinase